MDRILIEVAGTRLETTNPTLAMLVLTSADHQQEESTALASSIPAIGEAWPSQGGVYVGMVRGENGNPDCHLVVATDAAGATEKVKWGGYEQDEPGAANEYDGLANTLALIESEHNHPAAQWAAGLDIAGHNDWYLPARRELALCYANVPELFEKARWHWSSTQYGPSLAWVQDFDVGSQLGDHKDGECRARAVRRVVNP